MSEEIIKVLDALSQKVGLAVDWTSVNVIPYLQQICTKMVNYELWTSVAWIVIGLIPIILLIIFVKFCDKNEGQESFKADEDYLMAIGFILVISTVVGIIITVFQIFDIITCLTFPEKIIMNQLKDLYYEVK